CVTRRYEQSEIQEMSAKDGAKNFSSSPIKLGTSSGQARLTAQYSNQTQDFSGIPPSFVRLQASPQLSVLGIPLQGRIFLSTEAERFRYDLNTISLNLNQHQLLEKV
ncbi:MAG: hypothetical protein KDD99_31970, partial [Bacteroidetes bacterium]|nr:hypothetical protein [Bacteroidota bacterium]